MLGAWKMLAVTTVAACSGGLLAASAASAAYSIGPPSTPFTGTATTNQTFKIGAAGPTWTCTNSTFTGTTGLTASASTSFTAAFSGTGSGGSCPAGVLGNSKITVSGPWTMTVTGGGPAPGPYPIVVGIPSGSTVSIKPQTVPTCTLTITSSGNSALSGISATNTTPAGFRVYGIVGGIQYTASSGCPGIAAGTRADMTYSTGGTSSSGGIDNPGLTIAGP